MSCCHGHCVTSDLALEVFLPHPLPPPHSLGVMLTTWGNLQTLATSDTHLAYRPRCSWPKAQTSVNPPPAGPAKGTLGRGRAWLQLQLNFSGHKVFTQSLAPSEHPRYLRHYY